jgi:hypothetical protein
MIIYIAAERSGNDRVQRSKIRDAGSRLVTVSVKSPLRTAGNTVTYFCDYISDMSRALTVR